MNDLKNNEYQIIALEITDASVLLRFASFKGKICLIVGNEQRGVPEEILNNVADYSCHIEMVGERSSSLNLSSIL